jgi:pimeloyl-ACP methyl ester carboxylesterase
VLGAVLLRRRHARQLARRPTARAPAVHTDDGLRLHVEVGGRPDAPVTVILTHGLAASSEKFDAQWTALGHAARLVRYDQRGHGRSGWGSWRAATAHRLGRDLGPVVDRLGGKGACVLVGHSLGGMAVLALAAQHPELFGRRISGAVLISTTTGPLARAGVGGPGLRVALRHGGGRILALALWLLAPLIDVLRPFRSRPGRQWLRTRMFGTGDPPRDVARRLEEMWVDTPAEVSAAFISGLTAYDRRDAVAVLRRLPVVVIAGTADATFPASDSERLAHDIGPQARLVLVPQAGHMVNATHPDRVNAELLGLIDRVAGISWGPTNSPSLTGGGGRGVVQPCAGPPSRPATRPLRVRSAPGFRRL